MTTYQIRSIRWLGVDRCEATFDAADGELAMTFDLVRSPVGVLANPTPDIFVAGDVSAHELRQLVGLAVRFCLIAQGERVVDDEAVDRLGAGVLAAAVRMWTGRHDASMPLRDDARVIAGLGETLGRDVLPVVHRYYRAFYESEARWQVADLAEVGRVAASEFRARFPMLPDSVADDFAWCYTFDNR